MSDSLVTKIWEDVAERIGDDLRVVMRYEPTTFKTRMRDDVGAKYTTREQQDVVNDTILMQLRLLDTENSFKTGRLHALVRVFDDAWILTRPDDRLRKSGILISIERNGKTASMDDVDWCIRYLNDEISPLIGRL